MFFSKLQNAATHPFEPRKCHIGYQDSRMYCKTFVGYLRQTLEMKREKFFFPMPGSYINIFIGSKGMLTIVTKKHHDVC